MSEERRNYLPCALSKKAEEQRNAFMTVLSKVKPNSLASIMWKIERMDIDDSCAESPPPVMFLEDYVLQLTAHLKTVDEKINFIINHMPTMSEKDVKTVQLLTKEQGNSDHWKRARVGRITASNFGKVKTRMETMNKNPSETPTSLLKSLMDYEPVNPDLPQLKWGRERETEARKDYETVRKDQGHKNLRTELVGLTLLKEEPFIGASPDQLREM